MSKPTLTPKTDSTVFRSRYYLKEELTAFCRENGLPASGGKEELTDRIADFLETGKIPQRKEKSKGGKPPEIGEITLDTRIEENFVCSEKHRAFFKAQIGDGFSFPVTFQKWLKSNTGKTYREAVEAYREIKKDKTKKPIGRQFEYNTYIRDFFEDNRGKTLNDAIQCWKYKKGLGGPHRYERADLTALEQGFPNGKE